MNTLARRSFVQQPARRLPNGAIVCADYAPPTPKGRGLETCSGALIVGTPEQPADDIGLHAERLQAALLARRRTPEFYDASPVLAVLFGAIAAAGAALVFFWPEATNFFSIALPFTNA
ncbi:hypothetical protein [Xenophilus sp. Marseille-Q4582]|uniref:hypothetical protein n=1 Tax=Xenophilus sp. Marseille-Q4582 TaxID=2866600 RepID=UPI001CE3D477|nr:hypothetical protein [Xenophilus sp. Marseille-Q4582]